jgi:hypothetical protein
MWHSVALDPLAFDADTRSFMREAVNAFADVRLHEAAAVDRIREEAHAAELILMQHVLRRRYRAAACKACASHAFGFACHWCATFARRLTLDHVHVDALASLSLLACCCCSPQRHCPRRPALTPRRNRRVALQLTALGVLLAMAINVAALTQFEVANAWWRLARAFIRSNATQTSVEGLGVAPLTAVVETIATQMPEVLPYDSNEIGLYVSVFVSTAVVGLLSWWLSAVENEYKCGCGSCIRASRLLRRALAPLEDAAVAGKEVAVAVKENVVVATGRGASQRGLKVTKARPKDTSDPSARVQKCSPVRGDERTKRMRSELSRNRKRDPVSSVRAQSANMCHISHHK